MIEGEQPLPFDEPAPQAPEIGFTRDDRGYVYVDMGSVAAAARNVFPELQMDTGLSATTPGLNLDGDPALTQEWQAGIEANRQRHGRGTARLPERRERRDWHDNL